MIKLGNTLIFDIKEIAQKFDLSEMTVRRYIRDGRIRSQKLGNHWYITEAAIADFFLQPQKSRKANNIKLD